MTLREWLQDGPYTLALSSGFFGFFAHAGAISVLEEEGLLPRKLSGSSAGALVGGAWAAGVSSSALKEALLRVRREDFWDPAPGWGLLRGARFAALLDALLPSATFEACRAALAISVFDLRARKTVVLRRGRVADAIRASCGLPVLFHPVAIDGNLYADGGIVDRPGTAGAAGDARVLVHYLPSRSPWRFFYRPAQIPQPALGRVVVATDGLPRAGPFSLGVGARAMVLAARGLRVRLDQPLGS